MPHDVHKSLELLEEYHAELFRPSDNELRFCIEKVIGIFKTNLFSALCDLQEFYDNVLLNKNLSSTQKVYETRRFADRWQYREPIVPTDIFDTRGTAINVSDENTTSSLARSRQILSSVQQFPTISAPITVANPFLHKSTVNWLVDEFGREWEVEEVLIDASHVGLGFSISGGRDREPEPDHHIRITDISPGGAIAANGRLHIGDVILRINDVDCANVEHQVAVTALQRAGTLVRLLVKRLKTQRSQSQPRLNDIHLQQQFARPVEQERQRALSGGAIDTSKSKTFLNVPPQQFPTSQQQKGSRAASRLSMHSNNASLTQNIQTNTVKAPRFVTLVKGELSGLGFNIVGGEDNEPIYISHILPGGAADITGNVRKGDVLLRVNDINLNTATHAEAAYVLKSIPPNSYVSLLLQYRPKEYHDFEDKVIRLQNDLRLQQQQR